MGTGIQKDLYLIECVTNLHVGSGDSDFGLIDNRVQRDVLTEFPTIHSSSLKGALKASVDEDKIDILDIFGGEIEENGKKRSQQGKYKFFPANLLAIPVRSDVQPYFMATCPQILEDFSEMIALFDDMIRAECLKTKAFELKTVLKNKQVLINKPYESINIEDFTDVDIQVYNLDFLEHLKVEVFKKDKVLIITDEKFKELVSELPVIARNHLENGESKNLWYEEIVPRKSLFYFGVDKGKKENNKNKKETKETDPFDEVVNFDKTKGNLIHIGGNVTVGYGACKITKLGGQ